MFFDMPVKNKEKAYEKIIKISRNNDFITGNLLDFAYFKEYYRLIASDWVNKLNWRIHKKLILSADFKIKLNGATIFFIIEKSEEFSKIL